MRKLTTLFTIVLISLAPMSVFAQDLDSSNFTLVSPNVGQSVSGSSDSTNFSQLYDTAVSAYTADSTNFSLAGGFQSIVLANVPQVTCFETDTDSGSTNCTGLPGSDGMAAVCTSLGCFDRAKLEIDAQSNPDDTRYAIQISTTSDFSSDINYVDPTTRQLDSGALGTSHFIPKCEWEGTIVSGVCAVANTTYQAYNILGLDLDTDYYVRLSAFQGIDTNGVFSQTDWGPDTSATTTVPAITLDLDIAPDTVTTTNPPYSIDLGTATPTTVNTATDLIVVRTSTNLFTGLQARLRGQNGFLDHTTLSDTIPSVNGDLDAISGYGLRSDGTTIAADNTGTLGSITVASAPSDFTDSGADEKVGEVPTTDVNLFSSGGDPLDNGVVGFEVKVKPETIDSSGVYQEVITFSVYGGL